MVRSFLPKFSSRSERRLLALCKNNRDNDIEIKKWNKNAIQYLVMQLKRQNLDQTINELEKAISQECSTTKCVPLPKISDNRLLVSHRRGLPQVIYCRLWRWPDLQSHHQIVPSKHCELQHHQAEELQCIKLENQESNLSHSKTTSSNYDPNSNTGLYNQNCSPSSSSPNDKPSSSSASTNSLIVCVNPYHYEKKKPIPIEPVIVACPRIPPDLSTSFEDSDPTGGGGGGTRAFSSRFKAPISITGATVESLLISNSTQIQPKLSIQLQRAPPEGESSQKRKVSTSEGTIAKKVFPEPEPSSSSVFKKEQGPQDEQQVLTSGHCQQEQFQSHSQSQSLNYSTMDQSNQQQRQQYEQLEQPAGQRYGPQQHPSEQQPFAQVLDQPTQPSRHPSAMELEEQNSSIVEQKPSTERGPPIIEHRAGPPIIEHHPQTTTQYQPMQQPYPMDQQTQQYAPVQQYPTYDQQYPHAQYSQPQPVQYSPQQYSHPQIQPQPMQQYQQSQQQQQQQQQQQHQPLYHQPTEQVAYRMPTTPLQHTPTQGTMMSQSRTEVAHPYRFRQNKFARVARSVHHHIPHINTYDEHGKIRTYAIPQQQQQAQSQYPQQGQYIATSGPSAQGTFDQSQQQTQQPGTFAVPASPQQQTQSQYSPEYSVQAPQHPGPYAPAPGAYAESYPYHHEIQPDYQQSAPMSVGPMHSHASYQNPMPGPSYAVSGSMPTSSMGYFPSSMPQHMVNQPSSSRMSSQVDLREVPYVEMGKRWCSIAYHEYDMRVGEKFMPNSYTVHIDGFCDPALSNRFCLGTLTNVNRNEAVVWTRRRISKGVKLNYIDGEIFIECLSDSSIFVCSPLMDMEGGETEKVIKVPPGQTKLVFSNSIFSKFLHAAVDKGFETVYKLTAACSFRVSFGKGWGNAYKRVTILNTPCWFEVQLNGPLQWLDKVLRTLRPAQGCGSTS